MRTLHHHVNGSNLDKINKYATSSLKWKRIIINTMEIGELHLNYGNDSCLNFEKSFKRKSAQKAQKI